MAEFVMFSSLIGSVVNRLSTVLIFEPLELTSGLGRRVEWIEKELRLMQAFIEHHEQQGVEGGLREWVDKLNDVARDAGDVIETFVIQSVKRRRTGPLSWYDRYKVAKKLEHISQQMRDISQRRKDYEQQANDIAVISVESEIPAANGGESSLAMEKLNRILTQKMITRDDQVIKIVEHAKSELKDLQNIVSSVNQTAGERVKEWLKQVKEACDYTEAVAQDFIDTRERWANKGRLRRVFSDPFEWGYLSEWKLNKKMKYVRTLIGDALYRSVTYGVGGEGDKIGSRSRPVPSLHLQQFISDKLPHLIFGPDPVLLLMIPILPPFFFYSISLLEYSVFRYVRWHVSMWRSRDRNLKFAQRDLALMDALFSDIRSAKAKGLKLNKRQEAWEDQLRKIAQYGKSLTDARARGGLITKIKFPYDINHLLNEILNISERKIIYAIPNILLDSETSTVGITVVEHNDSYNLYMEQETPATSSYNRPTTQLKQKVQSLRDEKQLMDALFTDAKDIRDLDGRSKIWVKLMTGIADETKSVLHKYAAKLEGKATLVQILNRPTSFIIERKIDEIINKIQDASRRRKAYGPEQLQSRAERSNMLQKPNQDQKPWLETLDTVNMSLPLYLRKCLFYFLLFPAEYEIPARRLVVLWVAEGLMHHVEEEDPPEKVAKRCLDELIHLNMVQVVKRKSNNEVKTCRIPQDLRELLLTKANESIIRQVTDRLNEKGTWHDHILKLVPPTSTYYKFVLSFIQGNNTRAANDQDAGTKISIIRRVADHLDNDDVWHDHIHNDNMSASVSLSSYYKDVLSLLSFDAQEGNKPGLDIGNFLKRCISSNCLLQLRVLDLERVYKPKLPKSIGRLTRLRYLGLRWTYLESLPSSISGLLKLQTLDLKHTYINTLTSSIWRMELRHLFLSETYRTRLPPPPKRISRSLSDLQTLWGLFVDEKTPVKGGLDRLVNIRKLGLACQSMSSEHMAMESQLDAVADWIMKLEQLQSLRLKSRDEEGRPSNLYLKSLKNRTCLTDMHLL